MKSKVLLSIVLCLMIPTAYAADEHIGARTKLEVAPAENDVLAIYDLSATAGKGIEVLNLMGALESSMTDFEIHLNNLDSTLSTLAAISYSANMLSFFAAANYAAMNSATGLGTEDTPQFTGIELGHADDTSIVRSGAGDATIEGNQLYRAGGTDVPIADGGTNASDAPTALVNLGIDATEAEIDTPLDGALVTLTEFKELETIGGTTISADQWIYVGNQDQTTYTNSTPTFDGAGITGRLDLDDNDATSPELRFTDETGEYVRMYKTDGSTFYVLTDNAADQTVSIGNSGAGDINVVLDGDIIIGGSSTATHVDTCHATEPTALLVVGEKYCSTGAWNPTGANISVKHWVRYTDDAPATWVLLEDKDGKIYASSIEIASIDYPTLEAADLGDVTSPHVLTEIELKYKIISNYGASASSTYTMPEHTTLTPSWNVRFLCEDTDDMVIGVHANDTYYLNGALMDAGEDIVNEGCAIGEDIFCYSTNRNVICISDYFIQDTP